MRVKRRTGIVVIVAGLAPGLGCGLLDLLAQPGDVTQTAEVLGCAETVQVGVRIPLQFAVQRVEGVPTWSISEGQARGGFVVDGALSATATGGAVTFQAIEPGRVVVQASVAQESGNGEQGAGNGLPSLIGGQDNKPAPSATCEITIVPAGFDGGPPPGGGTGGEPNEANVPAAEPNEPNAPVDSDGDGTPDADDGCPDDPNKIEPGDCGCGQPDRDVDGNGVSDCLEPQAVDVIIMANLPGGGAAVGAAVLVFDADVPGLQLCNGVTLGDGRFRCEDVPVGTTVFVSTSLGGSLQGSFQQTIEPPPSGTEVLITVDLN
jgi:hypothetical protein